MAERPLQKRLSPGDSPGFLFLRRFTTEGAEKAKKGKEGFMRRGMAIIGALALGMATMVKGAASQHTVTVTLNYDFSVDNACSTTVTTGCVKQFNIYDITGGGTPVKLFTITAPSGANSAVTGITGTSEAVSLKAGVHTFAATAQTADGTESSPNASTATATVAPGSPASFSVTVQ
jgi:hypothetical protein